MLTKMEFFDRIEKIFWGRGIMRFFLCNNFVTFNQNLSQKRKTI